MEDKYYEVMRSYAWNYFSMHADQRLKTFNLYVTLATFIIGAFIAFSKDPAMSCSKWSCLLPFLLAFLSFVFWKFEARNMRLVRNGEAALKYLDEQIDLGAYKEGPHVLRIFARDDYFSGQSQSSPYKKGWTYSTCFKAVFIVFGYGSFILGFLCLLTK
ncbi:hypothetical protein BU251_07000 [Candidatus Velamenicoccus archaeovorus]|uniref:SMODS and SLOG-associating 2TM effector domain-containing protein n=1 Tax=Velamenicoccus archaeovorus TaxID=1930593 RepID=A0A410P5L0_VELA1|nr:hypothetical protein [Candidatus Velamenicoccus archaeovorus]QAT17477.1 hypothetical protein BU251_07000 [Candidatus Velamenicoccus archaeovorus]